jgi:predicted ribosomally synthesized peptide with SipW-like signal peptide
VKRRTIVAGLLMIGLVVMMLGVGSWAVFNDTETAPGVVGAGRLDLEINQSGAVNVEILDLKPSEWHYAGPFILHNAGNNPGVLDLHFTNVEDGQGESTEPEEEAEGGNPIFDISNWIDVDYLILDTPSEVCPTSGGTVLGKLADIESQTIDLGEVIEPSHLVHICLSFHLQREAGNEYQGDVTTFDVEFTLHQLLQPAGATTVRLENKTGDPDWLPITDDDLYGSVTYWVDGNNDLRMLVRLNGLAPNTYHQLALNGPDGTGDCEPVDDQLASGSEQYTNYDSGFWNGVGPNINQGTCASPNNEGIYNFAYVQTNAQGDWEGTIVVTNSGESDPADAGKVSAANPALPRGVYSDVKFIVKEVTGALPGTAWTPKLMEMVTTLSFNLP